MKKMLKKSLAVMLACMLVFSAVTCVAQAKEYPHYEKYVLLGDSVASGYSDTNYIETEFRRIEGSYGAIVADTIGAQYFPMACPGFRTIEMRYILEDDYEADDYLFYCALDKDVMESRIPEIRRCISEADIITLGVGGNDFGTYLTWVVKETMKKEGICEKYVLALSELLNQNGFEFELLDKIVQLADVTDALPELVRILPGALKSGLETFFKNWDKMIEDIYFYNPDVELYVLGMFDTAVKNEEDSAASLAGGEVLNLGQHIVDMANKPMKEGADKYGYTFVDTTGTICDTYHPQPIGYKFIAEKILEALPDASFPYTDVSRNASYYNDVEFVWRNGYMDGVTQTSFGVDDALTKAALAQALYAIAGSPEVDLQSAGFNDIDPTAPEFASAVWATNNGILKAKNANFKPDNEIFALNFAISLVRLSVNGGFKLFKFVKTIAFAVDFLMYFGIEKPLTRAQAAQIFADYCAIR